MYLLHCRIEALTSTRERAGRTAPRRRTRPRRGRPPAGFPRVRNPLSRTRMDASLPANTRAWSRCSCLSWNAHSAKQVDGLRGVALPPFLVDYPVADFAVAADVVDVERPGVADRILALAGRSHSRLPPRAPRRGAPLAPRSLVRRPSLRSAPAAHGRKPTKPSSLSVTISRTSAADWGSCWLVYRRICGLFHCSAINLQSSGVTVRRVKRSPVRNAGPGMAATAHTSGITIAVACDRVPHHSRRRGTSATAVRARRRNRTAGSTPATAHVPRRWCRRLR